MARVERGVGGGAGGPPHFKNTSDDCSHPHPPVPTNIALLHRAGRRASSVLLSFTAFAALAAFAAPSRAFAQRGNGHPLEVASPDSQQLPPRVTNPPRPHPRGYPTVRWLPRLALANDAFNFWLRPGKRSDEQFTNGVVASLETLGAPWWGRSLGGAHAACALAADTARACLTTIVTLKQDIYTPNLHRPPFSSETWEQERPYAAWLSLTGEGRRISPRAMRTLSLALGVTGKPSLGETMQDLAHHISARWTTEAHGWETQVGFQPGVVAGIRQDLLAARVAPGGLGFFDVTPFVAANVGNIVTDAQAGAKARIGVNLSHPWDPRAWRQRALWEFALTAAGRVDYVAHNFSLDGTLLNPTRHVTRTPGVSQYEFGAELRILRLSLAYRATTRGREYTTGPSHFTYSSMSAGLEFYR